MNRAEMISRLTTLVYANQCLWPEMTVDNEDATGTEFARVRPEPAADLEGVPDHVVAALLELSERTVAWTMERARYLVDSRELRTRTCVSLVDLAALVSDMNRVLAWGNRLQRSLRDIDQEWALLAVHCRVALGRGMLQ